MFLLSKVGWLLVTPSTLLTLLAALGIALAFSRRRPVARAGRRLAAGALVLIGLLGALPVGTWLLHPLENRFPAYVETWRPVAGAIALGGGVLADLSFDRKQLTTGDAGERVVALADLGRRQPRFRLVFTGGGASLIGYQPAEAGALARFGGVLGLDPARVIFERDSRTTFENARNTKAVLPPELDGRWLLVTSAWHMPRAMGAFRAAGIDVVAYPVDYRTGPPDGFWKLEPSIAVGLDRVDIAAKEWLGLLVYRLTGQSEELFPAP